MDGSTTTHLCVGQEQKVTPHCSKEWSRAVLRRLLYLTASHTTAGSLSSTRILVQAFNVQTLCSYVSVDFNLASDQSAEKRLEIYAGGKPVKSQVCINTLV